MKKFISARKENKKGSDHQKSEFEETDDIPEEVKEFFFVLGVVVALFTLWLATKDFF